MLLLTQKPPAHQTNTYCNIYMGGIGMSYQLTGKILTNQREIWFVSTNWWDLLVFLTSMILIVFSIEVDKSWTHSKID